MEYVNYIPFGIIALVMTLGVSFIVAFSLLTTHHVKVVIFEQWVEHLQNCGLIYPAVFVYMFIFLSNVGAIVKP
jgi:hypothetical protein